MNLEEAKKAVSLMPTGEQRQLKAAHARYMAFVGVWEGEVSAEQIAADQKAFSHLIRKTEDGRPRLSDRDAAEFMSAITGIDVERCLVWDEYEFIMEHGENFVGESSHSVAHE